MRIETSLVIIALMLLVQSCSNETKGKVTVTDYDLRHKAENHMEAEVIIKLNGDEKEYIIKDPADSDSLTYFVIKQDLNNDSLLMLFADTLHLINKKSYLIDGKSWEVKKYYSDAGGIADGEYLIYFNDELGMIALQSQAWGGYQLFDYENGTIGEYLKKDSMGFFHRFKDTPFDK